MLRWLWSWVGELGWYALIAGGWVCWFKAQARAKDLDRQLTAMAHSWRYTARQKDRTHG